MARTIANGAQRLVAAVLDCEKPVLAAVNGTAAGIGAHLAFACDLVVAAEGARFIEVFVRRGILPDGGGAYLLPRLIGLQKAKELVFFGDDLSAEDAAGLGLVNLVVPAGELAATAQAWAARLAGGPTVALGLAKRLLNRSLDADRGTAFAEEAHGPGNRDDVPRRGRGCGVVRGTTAGRVPRLVAARGQRPVPRTTPLASGRAVSGRCPG